MTLRSKRKDCTIKIITNNDAVYVTGEDKSIHSSITGTVFLDLKKDRDVGSIKIALKKSKCFYWKESIDYLSIDYVVNLKNVTVLSTEIKPELVDGKLPKGQYAFNFIFWIPEDIEPSISAEHGSIEYHLVAHTKAQPCSLYRRVAGILKPSLKTSVPINVCRVSLGSEGDMLNNVVNIFGNYYICSEPGLKISLNIQPNLFSSLGNENGVEATLRMYSDKHLKIENIYAKIVEVLTFRRSKSDPGFCEVRALASGNCKLGPSTNLLDHEKDNFSGTEKGMLDHSTTDRVDVDPHYTESDVLNNNLKSWTLKLPKFETEPLQELSMSHITISHFLIFSTTLKRQDKETELSSTIPVHCVPTWAENVAYSLPKYENSNSDTLIM
ncbi:hypothetical protein AX774_g5087 [Zancudomyces culisetae]|uniref:Arrestin-like N-terminal domain-containing protein n=1 Tax=Zancudomyces culisetae TaxID=1213189 RepID=A0A1R1PKH0_ZANCU|nr:hypothetical protein AX774_g5087 [Zancudomyces culisetae]|eukprot:OMH81456.1 hypothetical protein AX774_g5087 [Zancudomyces culisetae]